MKLRMRVVVVVASALSLGTWPALAQGGPSNADAGAASAAAPRDAGSVIAAPTRPDPGAPALKERGGRGRRTANPASGVVLVLLLVGGMGWYVMKRLRR